MSGHSKWANIKRQKQANDKERGNIFAKLSRVITLAVLEGGDITDPDLNVKLRLAIEKARQLNMPKENIKRAIERGVGPNKDQIKEVVYEAFVPGGAAMIVSIATDNVNRSYAEIRNIFEKHEGKIGNQGSVAYLFKKCGLVVFKKELVSEDAVFRFSEEMEALDLEDDNGFYNVYVPFENLGKIKEHIKDLKYDVAEIDYKPLSIITIKEPDILKKIVGLMNILDEHDDVQKIFINVEIPEQYMI